MSSVFNLTNTDATKSTAFFGPELAIARYDKQKYAFLEKLTDKQLSFFWRPEEIDIYRDAKDFKALEPHEQHIFTSNLKRQILLDSVQGRAPTAAFGPICSLPELENWIITWAFFETIHSRSYTHLIRNVYSDPSSVFDTIMEIKDIVDCAVDISESYDALINFNGQYGSYEHKKKLWLALMSVNILEGIRFYVSFACSWAFAEVKQMEGNAKIIKFICRDENIHLAASQQLLKVLPQEDKDFAKIQKESSKVCISMYESAVVQEMLWAKYLFKNGSIVGLNEQLLCNFVEWLANKRMTAIGLPTSFKGGSNPLPWVQKWISGSEVQVAPQEVQVSSYVVGGVKLDVNENTFKNMSL